MLNVLTAWCRWQFIHSSIYIKDGLCKADIKAVPEQPVPVPEPVAVVQQKPKITEDAVNDYIKQNPDTVSNYLRNERSMKAQRKQMHVRSLLNDAFLFILFYFILLHIIKDAIYT